MLEHFRSNSTSLYNACVRSKVSFKYSDTAVWHIRIVNISDYIVVFVYTSFDVFADCFSCAGDTVCIDKVFLCQFTQHRINSACLVKILHISVTCRSKVAEVWRSLAYFVDHIQIQLYAALMCNGRKEEH